MEKGAAEAPFFYFAGGLSAGRSLHHASLRAKEKEQRSDRVSRSFMVK
jgi:hypothetical protein